MGAAPSTSTHVLTMGKLLRIPAGFGDPYERRVHATIKRQYFFTDRARARARN
jgi:hypothetical protein